MPIVLRKALPSDADAVIDLLWQLNVFEADLTGDRLRDRGAAAAYHAELLQLIAKHGGCVVVALDEGRVVAAMGFATQVDAAYMDEAVRRYAAVTDLVVDGDHRGRGIGQLLLREAERLTREAGLKRLSIGALAANARAERTYREFGFEPYVLLLIKEV